MSETLENLLNETRQFPPPAELAAAANVTAAAYAEAADDRLAFWAEQARRLAWAKPWDQILDWSNPPFAKWFVGGQLNVAYNCLDRHVAAGRGDKVAIHWEGEPGDTITLTYHDLHARVCRFANALTDLGVGVGDKLRVTAASGSTNTLTITGVFDLGSKGANTRSTFMALRSVSMIPCRASISRQTRLS